MSIEGHFVGGSRFSNGLNANGPNSMPVEQLSGNGEDARPWRDSGVPIECRFGMEIYGHSLLTQVLPVSIYMGVTGQYHKADAKSRFPLWPATKSIRCQGTPAPTAPSLSVQDAERNVP